MKKLTFVVLLIALAALAAHAPFGSANSPAGVVFAQGGQPGGGAVLREHGLPPDQRGARARPLSVTGRPARVRPRS